MRIFLGVYETENSFDILHSMGKVIVCAGMSMSLDGFVSDENGKVDKLYPDFAQIHDAPSFQKMLANTGAVIMGRHVYEMADPFMWANDDYEFQCPIFVVTHTPPKKFPKGNRKLSFTFVTEGIESAVSQAKKAAGDKDVQVLGANTIQQCLNAGLCDELEINIIPVLLGKGLRLFEHIDTDKIQLERIKTEEITPARTGITFRVRKT